MRRIFGSLLFVFMVGLNSHAAWILKRVRDGQNIKEVGVAPYALKNSTMKQMSVPKVIKSLPEFLVENDPSSKTVYEEVLWPYDDLPLAYQHLARSVKMQIAGTELRTIVEQGPAANRICLTFTGDGYQASEKEKFFADVAGLVDDLFNGKTFQSYKSLFNIYAVFVPSEDSGITDMQTKNTAFGLYRSPAGSKRAIMPGNTDVIDQAIGLAPKTDYPIVIANDNFYGGLGGRYAITSSSRESGKIVLRHELGHNFGNVGEEYDGGSVYTGANSSSSENISWKQWLRDQQKKIVNDMRFLGGAYVWQNLEGHPVEQDFTFPGPNQKGPFWFEVQVSSVGWESVEDVEILLDGRKLEILGRGTADRSFFNTKMVQDLTPGAHHLEVREVNHDGDNVLAFANLFAYEADYDFSGGIGAFKTYDEFNQMTYRPTHQQCIMRDMLHEFFCPVDQENMWIEFLGRVNLIDSVVVGGTTVQLKTPSLNGLSVSWFKKDGGQENEIVSLRNQMQFEKSNLAAGNYIVKVQYSTAEVRKASDHLQDSAAFAIQ